MDPALDRARAVRDNRFKYIKNYEPGKPFVQFIPYRDQMALMQELLKYNRENKLDSVQELWFRDTKPVEELYDTSEDPFEVNNLATDINFQEKLSELRKAHEEWIEKYGDLGGIPETKLVKMLWPPNGIQPETKTVQYFIREDSVYLECPTVGASIVYRTSETINDQWELYTEPIAIERNPISATAIRIGYRQSDTVSINLN
jgi:hypothetical protein